MVAYFRHLWASAWEEDRLKILWRLLPTVLHSWLVDLHVSRVSAWLSMKCKLLAVVSSLLVSKQAKKLFSLFARLASSLEYSWCYNLKITNGLENLPHAPLSVDFCIAFFRLDLYATVSPYLKVAVCFQQITDFHIHPQFRLWNIFMCLLMVLCVTCSVNNNNVVL